MHPVVRERQPAAGEAGRGVAAADRARVRGRPAVGHAVAAGAGRVVAAADPARIHLSQTKKHIKQHFRKVSI